MDQSTRPWSQLSITLLGVYVAFDPVVSPHCRVVCVWEWNAALFNYEIRIAVYRSEIGSWGKLMGPFNVPYAVCFDNELVYFDIDGGLLKIMSLPSVSRVNNVAYFGELGGHLLIVVNDKASSALLYVFDMERDYSGWVSMYCCDLNPLVILCLRR
ncbi:F-box protein [Actinidia chinensis var. chinensis]|uniref:F-box protein n=1 Tax=Actinidia chinensis var. chinensis TaxID=1590841 RepID=A0A2R6QI81_ACTCC|nr:F-box protein [Actinidia chinensis var. chinensis]